MGDQKGIDLLGIKPIGEAINTTISKSFEGIEGFLKRVCAPALEEVGFLLKDQVRHWRLNNILGILEKAQDRLKFENEQLQIKAHPKVALSIIENGSMNDNNEVQELWAGLFVSSCTKDGQDDENLIFVDLLKQITVVEARIVNYSCEKARKIIHKNQLITADDIKVTLDELYAITGCSDIYRIDRELDHLRSLELIGQGLFGGFNVNSDTLIADISPTALALNLFIRCQGYNGEPSKYWNSGVISYEELMEERKLKEKEEMKKRLSEQIKHKETLAKSRDRNNKKP